MLHRTLAVAFLFGTTAAVFAQSSVSFEMFSDPNVATTSLVAGDFNHSGKPGLVGCCGTNGTLEFQAGNGDGTFQSPVASPGAPDSPGDFTAADLTGDGNLDVVAIPTVSDDLSLYVWHGNGNGTFESPLTYPINDIPASVATGNFFGDGHVDIAVGEKNGNIDLFRNEGNGTFVLDKSINLGGSSFGPIFLAAGDLNGNGVSDIAATGYTDVIALWNDGKGNFTQQALDTYHYPTVSISRLNGDGQMDILVSYVCNFTPTSGEGKGPGYEPCAGFDVYYGEGGNHLAKRTVVTDSGVFAANPRGADVNGDGYGDIVANGGPGCNCLSGVFVWLGNADGSFQQTPQEFITTSGAGGSILTMADFNRDGMMDFAMGGGQNQYFINATTRAACGTYTISPTVTACRPVDNTYSPSPVRVEANSYDSSKVTTMQEYIDGSLKYSQPVSSFNTTFAEDLGAHSFATKAWDAAGHSFVADRTVTVYDGTPGPVCPAATDSASICLPAGDTSSSPVLILANGNTGTEISTSAQLYIDGKLVVNNQGYAYTNGNHSGGSSYVQTTQDLSAGTHDLVFKLWGAGGDVYTATKKITVN